MSEPPAQLPAAGQRRKDRPRPDPRNLPAAGAPSRRNLNTIDEKGMAAGNVPTHYTFVDGAVQERPGGRRPPTRGLPATSTKVGECLGRALSETSNEKSVAQHFTLVDGGIPTTKPKGGRRTQFAESPRARDRSEEEKDHRPGRARGDFAVTTSVGRVLRQEPPSATEQVVLKVR
jgi:hypothetical protein